MSHEEQVGKNFAWGASSQLIVRLFGLAFFVLMSHLLFEKGMGQYGFIIAFVPFWFIFSDFGISSYLYREWSKGILTLEEIKHDFNVAFTIKILMSTAVFVPFCIVNWFINKEVFLSSVLYFIFITLSLIVSQVEAYLNSINNFKTGAIRSLLEKAVVIFVGGFALLFFPNVEVVFAAMILSQFASLGYYFAGRFPFVPSLIVDWSSSKRLIKKGIPFVFFAIVISIYGRIDMIMLKFMQSFETVGWYSAGYKAYEIANIFPGVLFLPALFPTLSRVFNLESRERYREFFNRSIRILFTSSLLVTVFFIFFAQYAITWFFPESFIPSILVMRIIVLVLTVSSLSVLFNALLIIQNKEKMVLKIVIVSCAVNVILNFILIPKYSLYGSAWATVIAEGLNLFLLQHYADWDKDKKMVTNMFLLVFILIGAFSAISIFNYTNNIWVAGLMIGFTTLSFWVLDLIRKSDLEMFYLPFKSKFKLMFYK